MWKYFGNPIPDIITQRERIRASRDSLYGLTIPNFADFYVESELREQIALRHISKDNVATLTYVSMKIALSFALTPIVLKNATSEDRSNWPIDFTPNAEIVLIVTDAFRRCEQLSKSDIEHLITTISSPDPFNLLFSNAINRQLILPIQNIQVEERFLKKIEMLLPEQPHV